MATFTWNAYIGAGPAWADISTNTVVFSGSSTDLSVPITVGTWNDGTHLGNGNPGTDQCGANHMNNVKYITSTECDIGGGTTTLNDTNVANDDCTLQIIFNEANSTITNARFYCFDSTTTTTEAVGVEVYAWERGVSDVGGWNFINDDSANIGGDQGSGSTEVLDLVDQSSATDHTYYVCVAARPETVGAKSDFDFGIALTYS